MTTKRLISALNIALDSASQRTKDINGFLHIRACHIAKEMVYPYLGYELPDVYQLPDDETYYAYLPGDVLRSAAKSFEGLPLLLDHHDTDAEHPDKEHVIGSTGTDAIFAPPYLDVSLHVTDQDAIDKIESGEQRELSIGFIASYRPYNGVYQGEFYDFIFEGLRGNHVALVPEGRAGHDVLVADSIPSSKGFANWLKRNGLTRTVKSWPRS